ncbi:unnamed protein product [Paramecium sonneborni]|uniref:Uncharacterized protein n=1 Tax=Paramecium sonneborni TaxID=65129 RepID=A0A8S1QQC6_9CILI|nr:unnamed protein product [Paramecium sonneborni]
MEIQFNLTLLRCQRILNFGSLIYCKKVIISMIVNLLEKIKKNSWQKNLSQKDQAFNQNIVGMLRVECKDLLIKLKKMNPKIKLELSLIFKLLKQYYNVVNKEQILNLVMELCLDLICDLHDYLIFFINIETHGSVSKS